MSPELSRTLTAVAAAVLGFDGAAIAGLGLWSDRLVLVPVGLAFFAAAALVLVYWRWYQRRLRDIAAARRALADQARDVQRLLGKK